MCGWRRFMRSPRWTGKNTFLSWSPWWTIPIPKWPGRPRARSTASRIRINESLVRLDAQSLLHFRRQLGLRLAPVGELEIHLGLVGLQVGLLVGNLIGDLH